MEQRASQSPNNNQRWCSKLLLDIAALLMSSGAHTERVEKNVQRISESLGYHADLLFSLTGVTLTICPHENPELHYTVFRRIKSYGVHMGVVSAVSRLSWSVQRGQMDRDAIHKEVERIKRLPHYPKTVLVVMVMLAGMAFCRVAGGEVYPTILTGLATGAGFLIRNSLLSRGYNVALSITCASFVASGLSGLGIIYNLGNFPEIAVATSVLFLIPGVPMINSVIDLMHGQIIVGYARVIQGAVISFAIATGIVLSSALLGVLS